MRQRVKWVWSVFGVSFLTAGLVSGGLGGSASVAPTLLFSSSTPGFVVDAATVPADVECVTVTADGGHGGSSNFDRVARPQRSRRGSR